MRSQLITIFAALSAAAATGGLAIAARTHDTPVAAVHGDSHHFRIDKPLLDSQGRRLENFTWVETFGDHQENGDNDVT
jgi:hypothetical protein